MKEILITENESNQRLDRFLQKLLPNASKGFIQKMLRKKNIKLNQQKAEASDFLKIDDCVTLYFSDETYKKFSRQLNEADYYQKSALSDSINPVFESDHLLVVNKPAGLLTQPDKSGEKSLIDQALTYLIDKKAYDPNRELTFAPACSNRLDRNTSGIVLIPKDFKTLQMVNQAIRKRETRKIYLTLVVGETEASGCCRHYFEKSSETNRSSVADTLSSGKQQSVLLNYRRLAMRQNTSLLEIDLKTGKSHQIRVQLAHINHPIIGDPKYGDPDINKQFRKNYQLKFQLLHSFSYCLDDQCYTAPIPDNFLKILKDLNYDMTLLKELTHGLLE
ncbi:MAG: rRNA pseudouridine synthase [Eubacteriaceae bacterium]|jgi:23S rRNA pseudouridine955/2504/2580 synthase|nr:rRNA pseudouridine synthase [Eubacteriaceae bacterium]